MKFILVLLIIIFASAQNKTIKHRPKTLQTTGELHANNVKAIVANNGWLFWGGGASGFITPSPVFENNHGNFATVFASGIWFVGRVDGELKAAIANYATDFIPGDWDDYQVDPIANGRDNTENIIYYYYNERHIKYLESLLNTGDSETDLRINSFAVSELEKAQNNNALWSKAIAQGAPEIPPGDLAAFTIFHDADTTHRSLNGLNESKSPLNIQVRQLSFSYRSDDALNNTVFVKVQVINKNNSPIEDFYTTIWADADVGQYGDDLVGSDQDAQMAYAYNGYEEDAQYTNVLGIAPPAVGYKLLQGFLIDSVGHQVYKVTAEAEVYVNESNSISDYLETEIIQDKYVQQMTGMFYYNGGEEADNAEQYYNNMTNRYASTGGLHYATRDALESGLIDSTEMNWMYSGNPILGDGWIDKNPNDRRFLANMNKTTLGVSNGLENFEDPGYNELIFAVFTSFGKNNLASVSQLKFDAYDIQETYNLAFKSFEINNPAPILSYTSTDSIIRLYWEGTTEEVNSQLLSTEQNFLNGYKFEGYQLVQFKDEKREDFIVIATQDIQNDVKTIFNRIIDPNTGDLIRELTIQGKDQGINYFQEIALDYYSNRQLMTNNKYYYGIRAYYQHPDAPDRKSYVKFGEWNTSDEFYITKDIELGTEIYGSFGQEIDFESFGVTDGVALISVINPYAVTGSEFKIKFKEFTENSYYLGYPNDTIPENTLGWYLEKDGIQVSKLLPQSETTREFNYSLFYEGLKIIVTGPQGGFKNFTVVANANGVLDPPDMAAFAFNATGFPLVNGNDRPDGSRQQANGSTWGIHTAVNWMSDPDNKSYQNFIEDVGNFMGGINGGLAPALAGGTGIHHAGSDDFEIRFTSSGSKAMLRDEGTRHVVDVPFELWNTGVDPNDSSDDYKMVAFIRDRDGNKNWNILPLDHSISGGLNDPHMEGITFLDPSDKSPGTAGYDALVSAATPDAASNWESTLTAFPYAYNSQYHSVGFNAISLVNWNGGNVDDATFPANLDASVPEEGTIFRISLGKINNTSTVLSFKAPDAPLLNDTKLAKSQFKENLTVFPNPFYVAQSNQTNVNDTYVTFANLPVLENNESVDITIYSLNGSLVKNIKYEGQTTLQRWELDNNSNRKIKSGLYIAVLKYGNITVIKKILIFV